jgi:hypothetical protein
LGTPVFDLTRDHLTRPDTVFQIGVPPMRVDILSGISGVDFADAWERRMVVAIEGQDVPVLSREDFVANKRAAGRDYGGRLTGREFIRLSLSGPRYAVGLDGRFLMNVTVDEPTASPSSVADLDRAELDGRVETVGIRT